MTTDAMEREAKLGVDLDFALPALNGVVYGVVSSELPHAELVATYYDTPDRRLLQRGITLRHRRDRSRPGDRGEWTLKLPVRSDDRLLERNELSWPGDDTAVAEEAIRLLRAIVRHAELRPLIRLITSRRRVEIRGPDGRPLAEVDDDTVAVMNGLELADRFREVEVELKLGDDALLDSLVARLAAAGVVPGAGVPKVARALGLDAVGAGPPSPPTLRDDSPLADVVTAAVAAGVERLISHDLQVRLTGDPEHVHQARVATRRLRSDLRTFSEALDPDWTTRVRDGLRTVGTVFGRVRDADVLAERLWTEAAEQLAAVDREGLGPLQQRLAEEREEAFVELLGVLDTETYLDLLDQLTATPLPFVEAGHGVGAHRLDPDAPAARALVPLVRRPWQKLRRAVVRLGDDPPDQELHQIRIRAKRLRYAAEAASPVMGPEARGLAKAAADLQDVLGAHHDAVTAEAWLRGQADTGPNGRALFVTGQLVAGQRFEQARLRQEWRGVWKALDAKHLRHWLK